jgi:ankyrin repeat protein
MSSGARARFLAKKGDLGALKSLFEEGIDQTTAETEEGRTVLLCAAASGQLQVVKWLLTAEGGSHISEADRCGNTCLLLAAEHGHLENVIWLLKEGGSSIDEMDSMSNTSLICAAAHDKLNVVQWLLTEGGASITEMDSYGMTPLLCAASNGALETVKWLLSVEGGASIKEVDTFGNTSLLLSADGHYLTCVWLLEHGGAKITETDGYGLTVWSQLTASSNRANAAELSSLFRVMVLLGDAPPDFLRKLKPQHALIFAQGKQMQAQLPEYIEQQQALLAAHCPLPTVLHPLVHAYAEPTHEDMWTDWLLWLSPLAAISGTRGREPIAPNVR